MDNVVCVALRQLVEGDKCMHVDAQHTKEGDCNIQWLYARRALLFTRDQIRLVSPDISNLSAWVAVVTM